MPGGIYAEHATLVARSVTRCAHIHTLSGEERRQALRVGPGQLPESERQAALTGPVCHLDRQPLPSHTPDPLYRSALGKRADLLRRPAHDESARGLAEQYLRRRRLPARELYRSAEAAGEARFGERDGQTALGAVMGAREATGAESLTNRRKRVGSRGDVDLGERIGQGLPAQLGKLACGERRGESA